MARDLQAYTFGHHPEVSIDFCIEIDDLTGYAYDLRTGMNFMPGLIKGRSQWPFWARLSRMLAFARTEAGKLDECALAAIPTLLRLEGYARHADAAPKTALLSEMEA